MAHFFYPAYGIKKPGFPLQVLGSADALPVGFPLQSLAPHGLFALSRPRNPLRMAAQNQVTELPWQFRGQVIAYGNYLRITRRSQF
jgi:hypothetical protein